MNPLRMGVIGCGAIAQIMHIPHIVDHEQFQLVALADMSRPVLDAVGDRYHVGNRYTDYHDLLARDDIDAVCLCHSGSHRESVIAALDANKHVFVEKPLTMNVREAREVAERASRSDRIVQPGYHKLYDPAFAYTKKHIGQMRDLSAARITMLHPANELGFAPHRLLRGSGVVQEGHTDPKTWDEQVQMQTRDFAGGAEAALVDEALGARKDDMRLRLAYGIIATSIIHQIYTMHGFLGDPLRVISTNVWRKGHSIHALIEYPEGLVVILDWHYLNNLADYFEEYAFWGNYDRVRMELPSPYYRNYPSPVIIQGGEGDLSWEKRVTVSHDEAFRRELLAFYDNVRNHTEPLSSVAQAVKHMAFAQALIDAAR